MEVEDHPEKLGGAGAHRRLYLIESFGAVT